MSKANTLNAAMRKRIQSISYDGCVDKHRVANENNFSVQTAERRIRTLGLKHSPQHLIDMLRDFRSGVSPKQLAEKYAMSVEAVRSNLNRRGEKMRNTTYYSDFNFFDNIDTEEKAYILGFIYADGCLHKNSLSISLAVRDIKQLHKIKRALRSERPVTTTNHKTGYGMPAQCNFVVTHPQLRKGLLSHGVTERKTESCRMPSLPTELVRHFIRGYVDGDGSFGKYVSGGYSRYSLSICVTPDMLLDFRNIFSEIVGSKGNEAKRHKKSKSTVTSLRYSGKETVITLLNYLYGGSTIRLDRKFAKYLRIVHNKTGCNQPVTPKL